MLLTRYGVREWSAITAVAVIAAGLCALGEWWWAAGVIGILWLALVAFFRDPVRRVPMDLPPGAMVSPADGTVSAVFTVDHHDATGGPAMVVRIFLSIFDVHVNRSPADGAVVSIVHTPGRHLDARREESARVNESNLVIMRLADPAFQGDTIGVRQVSGAVARRIVCPLKPGDTLRRGQRFGMIKFGSTTELILPRPDDVTVHVRVGDKVKGGLTVLATLGASQTAQRERTRAHAIAE